MHRCWCRGVRLLAHCLHALLQMHLGPQVPHSFAALHFGQLRGEFLPIDRSIGLYKFFRRTGLGVR